MLTFMKHGQVEQIRVILSIVLVEAHHDVVFICSHSVLGSLGSVDGRADRAGNLSGAQTVKSSFPVVYVDTQLRLAFFVVIF